MSSDEGHSSTCRQTGFRLHYFPDIPVDGRLGVRRCAPDRTKFQRTRYESSDPTCLNSTTDVGLHRTVARKTPLSAAEREEQAYRKGFDEGRAQGLSKGETAGFEQGTQKIAPLVSSIKEALVQLNAIRKETYRQIEKEVAELALAIAQKVICREVATDKNTVACVAKEALARVDDPGKITIKLNPADLHFINKTKYQLANMIADVNHVNFEGDEGIQSGGCIIETELGEIDARIEKQLEAVKESFLGNLEKENPGS